ncbi:hypothetical protein KJ359_008947 [Pestalotiopsis sp. 9143b]|nr:hypothetical protein KJ359_008947 [Pestalotiopsis sp. 9143b]
MSIADKLNKMTPKISARVTGLRILVDPKEDDEVDIDVVAVHGIGVHPEHTWVHRDTKVNWLSEPTMLPAALPKARIMAFGYESYWYGENAIKQTVSSVAGQLLKALDAKRVVDCIAGMVFLGTPHYGIQNSTAFSTQGDIYQRIAQAEVPIVDDALHTMAHNNDMLVDIVSKFTRKIAVRGERGEQRPKLYCFYEQKPTKVGLIAGMTDAPSEFVLNESSASLSGHEKEALALDHFGMNKFEAFNDSAYEAVVHQITELAGHARKSMSASPLAVEYAHKFHRDHPDAYVHWVNAGSASQFELSYRRIGENLHLSKKAMDTEDVFELVSRTMRQDVGGQWLMVLDGLDDKTLLMTKDEQHGERCLLDFIPRVARARILTTTRSKSIAMEVVAKKAEFVIDIQKLQDGDASLLLHGREVSDEGKKKKAAKVSKVLGGSAGLLVLAHTYRRSTGLTWTNYLENIRGTDQSTTDVDPAMRAWELTYQLLKEKDPGAAHLLLQMGSLDVQSISTVLFERQQFPRIEKLVDYGMVEPSTDRRLYTVTPLIRRCVQTWLAKNKEQDDLREHILSVMCEKFPADDSNTAELLLPCALVALSFQISSNEGKRHMAILSSRVGQHYMRLGRKLIALKYLKQCLSLQENDPGAKVDAIQETKNVIAKIEVEQKQQTGKPSGVQSQRSHDDLQIESAKVELKKLEKQLGKDHYDVVRKASDLAALQIQSGDKRHQDEAIAHYQRGLQWYKDKEMEGTMDTASNQYNLALAHENSGQLEKASSLYQSASEITQRHLGPSHPLSLRNYGNLASLYCKQGQMKEGEKILAVVLQNQRKVLGEDHPETLETRRNVAMVLEETGQIETAGKELEDILKSQMRLRDDAAALRTLCSIAGNFRVSGRKKDAREMLEATLAAQEKLLGGTHRDTATTRVMLQELMRDGSAKAVRS